MTLLSSQDFRLDWDKLKIFYYIAKLENITRAAEFLYLSQSALSKSLKILENRLQTQLFYRETKGLQLTQKGEALFKIVEKCYTEMQHVKEIINENNNRQENIKIFLCSEISSLSIITSLSDLFNQQSISTLSIEKADYIPSFDRPGINILIHPFIKERRNLLRQHLLSTMTYGLYGSQRYFDRFSVPQNPAELNNHQLISSKLTASLFPHISAFQNNRNAEKGKLSIEINSASERIQLALHGLGIIAAPQNHHALKQGELVQILPEVCSPTLKIYYIYSKHLEPLKHIKSLGQSLKKLTKE